MTATVRRNQKIFVAGHKGMVGSAIVRALSLAGYQNILTVDRTAVDLSDSAATRKYLQRTKPDYIFMAAAKVGGILANSRYPAQFIGENLAMATSVIQGARDADVQRMLFLGSSCIYPRDCRQPMREVDLLSGPLEATNEPYAIAKIAGIKMCEAFNREFGTSYVSALPTNLYGPGDHYDAEKSHVLPALILKAHDAKVRQLPELVAWGTGQPHREFMHVDDVASACVFMMEIGLTDGVFNVGTGSDIRIRDLVAEVATVVGYTGSIRYDSSKPDGTPRKLLDVSKLRDLGWTARIPLRDGITDTYRDFLRRYPIALPA